MIPDRPPMVKVAMSPAAKWNAVVGRMLPPHMVPSQLKIFTPVGMAISMVATENAASATGPIPVANMWCAHTPKPKNPMRAPE